MWTPYKQTESKNYFKIYVNNYLLDNRQQILHHEPLNNKQLDHSICILSYNRCCVASNT